MSKQVFVTLMALSMVLPLSACGEKIDPSAITEIHWKCDLFVNGDRTGSTEDYMFQQSGKVKHIIYPTGRPPGFFRGEYKFDGERLEITDIEIKDGLTGATMPTGFREPNFVGKVTRIEPSHMEFEGILGGDDPTKIKGDCVAVK